MTPDASISARRAALLGTRAAVAQERFDALVAMLVAAKVVSAEQVDTMATRLCERLTMLATGELQSEWQVHPGELRIEAARYACSAGPAGSRQLKSPTTERRPSGPRR
jgi:hypothetical protein